VHHTLLKQLISATFLRVVSLVNKSRTRYFYIQGANRFFIAVVSIRRVVGPTIAAADQQSMHLPVLGVHQHSAALSAGVINSVGARY
jgi:hypothetical protein